MNGMDKFVKKFDLGAGELRSNATLDTFHAIASFHAQVVSDLQDQAVVDAIVEAAREDGISELLLLDRQFVINAIKEYARKMNEEETPMIIPSAKETRATQTNRADFEEACKGVLREIEKAKANGRFQAHFDPRPVQQYDAVKHAFEEKGYWFTPTGYIGGVWQLTENINW